MNATALLGLGAVGLALYLASRRGSATPAALAVGQDLAHRGWNENVVNAGVQAASTGRMVAVSVPAEEGTAVVRVFPTGAVQYVNSLPNRTEVRTSAGGRIYHDGTFTPESW